jgi:hypothetical protein
VSNSEEIRGVLRSASGPLTGRELCNAIGCENAGERERVYKTVAAMVGNGSGVERLDDGRYSLIPGWRPKRQPRNPVPLGKALPPAPASAPPVVDSPQSAEQERTAPPTTLERTARVVEAMSRATGADHKSALIRLALSEAIQLESASRLQLHAAERLRARIEAALA